MKRIKILAYLPHHIKNYGIGYAAHSLSLGMNNSETISDIFSIRSDFAGISQNVKQAFTWETNYRIATKFLSTRKLIALTEQRFIKQMKKYDVAYLWPGCSLETVQYLKSIGKIIVFENINCHQRYAKTILDVEESKLGISEIHQISEESIRDEDQKLKLADFIFSPSPEVTKSLFLAHLNPEKIIESSYGLDVHEILSKSKLNHPNSKINALFVGSVIPRKGVHLLLDYWESAAVDGKLTIIGKVDDALKSCVEKYEAQPNFEFVPFTNDLESYYSKADIFLMPSLEEGSPLVTYLALGAGLPAVLSPMAGKGVYENDEHGFIIDAHDKTEWVNAIVELANDHQLRSNMSLAIHKKVSHFLWPEVAKRRVTELHRRLENI